MPGTELHGPNDLTEKQIDAHVKGVGIGAYALGCVNDSDVFVVEYAGRSDTNLNERLKDWTGQKYKAFKYGFFKTVKAAFERECHVFHDFGGTKLLDNIVHPARPEGADYSCPNGDCTDLD